MQQALGYAEALDVPFVFASNGDAFLLHDRTGQSFPIEKQIGLDEFPSPDELWRQYRDWKGLDGEADKLVRQPYYADLAGKEPRYYQRVAGSAGSRSYYAGTAAGADGHGHRHRQDVFRLSDYMAAVESREGQAGAVPCGPEYSRGSDCHQRLQAFWPVMTKVRNRDMDPSYEIYIALYQAVSGSEEEKNIYRQFSREFFDLVVIDECHRGSAREASAWREILDYFEPAIQLGLTATPKETTEVSTLSYFGDPILYPTVSSRALTMVFSRRSRSCALISTRICRVGGPQRA